MMEKTEQFLEACKNAALEICLKKHEFPILIYSHFDTDGIAAASILAIMFQRKKIPFQMKIKKRLEYSYLQDISKTVPKDSVIIFSDLGSGVIDAFYKWDTSIQIYILDHHFLDCKSTIPKNIHVINPHCYSIDGSSAISGSGVAYFIATSINPKNKNLAHLAIIGALGDRQDQGENSSLIGLNQLIVQDAIKQHLCSVSVSLWFFDRTRDIKTILKRMNIDDFSEDLVIHLFLEGIGIPLTDGGIKRIFFDLKEEEKRKIASELIIKYNVDPEEIYKHDYLLLREGIQALQDARVYASRLNACGRVEHPEVGIAICMGDRHLAIAELNSIRKEYSRLIGFSLNWATSEKNLKELPNLYFLDGRTRINESILGPITSILSSMKDYQSKPILSCARIDESRIKISMRKSRLLNKRLELNKILTQGTEDLGLSTEVGGHSTAAGAIINESDLESFKNQIDTIIEELLTASD